MAGKQSGLGSRFFVGEYDLSGDTSALSQIASPRGVLPATGVNVFAMERMHAHRDGVVAFTSYFNPDTGRAHAGLSGLPTTDRIVSFFVGGPGGAVLGNPAASITAKQIGYDGTRAKDGSLTFDTQAIANSYGLEWGQALTAGSRTDTAATNGSSVDQAAATSFGWQAYLHVLAFTGTNVTISLEDSANNSAWTALSGGAFTQTTAVGQQRLQAASSTATARRYVRAVTTTAGGFTSVTFALNFVKNLVATTF